VMWQVIRYWTTIVISMDRSTKGIPISRPVDSGFESSLEPPPGNIFTIQEVSYVSTNEGSFVKWFCSRVEAIMLFVLKEVWLG
jgi:hypothetical protein